jgi:hypothetical protein
MSSRLRRRLVNLTAKLPTDDLIRLAVVIPLAWLVLELGYNADFPFYVGPNVAWNSR